MDLSRVVFSLNCYFNMSSLFWSRSCTNLVSTKNWFIPLPAAVWERHPVSWWLFMSNTELTHRIYYQFVYQLKFVWFLIHYHLLRLIMKPMLSDHVPSATDSQLHLLFYLDLISVTNLRFRYCKVSNTAGLV